MSAWIAGSFASGTSNFVLAGMIIASHVTADQGGVPLVLPSWVTAPGPSTAPDSPPRRMAAIETLASAIFGLDDYLFVDVDEILMLDHELGHLGVW